MKKNNRRTDVNTLGRDAKRDVIKGDAFMFVPKGFKPAAQAVGVGISAARKKDLDDEQAVLRKVFGYGNLREVAQPGVRIRDKR